MTVGQEKRKILPSYSPSKSLFFEKSWILVTKRFFSTGVLLSLSMRDRQQHIMVYRGKSFFSVILLLFVPEPKSGLLIYSLSLFPPF